MLADFLLLLENEELSKQLLLHCFHVSDRARLFKFRQVPRLPEITLNHLRESVAQAARLFDPLLESRFVIGLIAGQPLADRLIEEKSEQRPEEQGCAES